jgi:hypothetical protein
MRAGQLASGYYNRIASQPAGEYEDVDMAAVAEAAESHSYQWWNMMTSLRQTMLNLIAVGLFHLVEQQLATLSHDGLFNEPVKNTKVLVVADWFQTELGVNLKTMPSWNIINEMRLVGNTVKHGEGGSARDLREANPALFTDPTHAEFLRSQGLDPNEIAGHVIEAPLSGEDFFVTEDILRGYAENAVSFFFEIADEVLRSDDCYQKGEDG